MAAPPVGWTARTPGLYNALLALVAQSLSAQVDATFITGYVGGGQPPSQAGSPTPLPWLNGQEWWVWDPTISQYIPSQQGCPVGTIMMWGMPHSSSFPSSRWMHCDGSILLRSQYPRLFTAIGTTWGTGYGKDYFQLPPTNCFYFNVCGGFGVFDPSVPITVTGHADGTNVQGGSQRSAPLAANTLPAMQIRVPFLNPQIVDQGGADVPNIGMTGQQFLYPVQDESGNPVGSNQQPIPIMPPFLSVHFLIKYL